MPFKFKITNWKLAILAVFFIGVFIGLGFWQVSRAHHKEELLSRYKQRIERAPFHATDLNQPFDWRFYRAELAGTYDNAHTLLLDNKTFHGQIGYEVYTPFNAVGLRQPILVDRGFIPMGKNRAELPAIKAITGPVIIIGMLNTPPTYVALGQINESNQITWPLRIEFVNPAALAKFLPAQPFAYLLTLDPRNPAAYAVEWQITTMSPEKHMGYAVQWFALALTLLILFVVLNRDKTR